MARTGVSLLVVLAVVASAGHATGRATRASDEWAGQTWEERHDTMTWGVLPTMARLFARFRGKDTPDLTCRTCHGADAEQAQYKMPRGLVALDPARLPSRRSHDPAEARLARFMEDEVTPTMRELLGARSVTCFTCHPRKAPR